MIKLKERHGKHVRMFRLLLGAITAVALVMAAAGCSAGPNLPAGNAGNSETPAVDRQEAAPPKGTDASSGSDLVIPISGISETATFYQAEVDGIKLEVLAVKAPDGTIRTAFNTCQVCYGSPQAYFEQSGDVLVCQNCGNRFKMSHVEVESGGCNPWPIFAENKTVDDENITISYDFLKESSSIFENWKDNY